MNEPLGGIARTFFGKIQDVPINYLMGTLQSHDWVHCGCTGHVLGWDTAGKLAWKILNVLAVYRVGIWWVHCPFPCSVFVMYPVGTLGLVPSDSSKQRLCALSLSS